jgi:hypothetical protein
MSLLDGEFDLGGYVMGDTRPVYVEEFDPGANTLGVQDVDNPAGNDRRFGRDKRYGSSWAFGLVINQKTQAGAATVASDLERVWAPEKYKPGEVVALRYGFAGRTRLVYGRPRRYAAPSLYGAKNGIVRVSTDFLRADAFHYDDDVRFARLDMHGGRSGGLKGPLKGSLKTVAGGVRQGVIPAVGGDASTPPLIKIQGPIANPSVWGNGWWVELATSLKFDQSVTIDTRMGTVLRNDGANLGGTLSRRSRLPNVRMKPGSASLSFRGQDLSGTSHAIVEWRPAFYGF